jgi:16S rRNA (cytidine1402-2'-O)-methyltransferase
MEDITLRALKVLKDVDIILCEDTRESSVLLNHYDIHKKLISCHKFNEKKLEQYIIEQLNNGLNLALISDQGSPIISDPGYIVTTYVVEHGYNVVSLPGATAFVPALSNSCISSEQFLFYGFLNNKKSKKISELNKLKYFPYTLIFYETPHDIINTLESMIEVLGDREISISREISKVHESVYRGKISDYLKQNDILKGEFVIIVSGYNDNYDFGNLDIVEHVNLYINDGLSEMDALKRVAKDRNLSKSIVYSEYHKKK